VQHNASNHFNDGIAVVDLPSWTSTQVAFASFAQTGIYWAWGEHIQDGDADERYFTSSPNMAHTFFDQQPESFPRYVFKAFSPWAW